MPVPTLSEDVLVLGIGNPLMGDDGVGIRVIEILKQEPLPAGTQVEEAGLPGWGLPAWFEGRSSVILVDAVQMGREPGEWKRFNARDIQIILEDSALSLHQSDLACGLALSQALNVLPENLVLYGIQPAETATGAVLSPDVDIKLPDIVESIRNDLEKAKE
jgi:hydrogenase maturation protease